MTKLYAPQEYRQASQEERSKLLNGCGPDGFVNRLIPNSILGVDVTEACNIHDWMSVQALDLEERIHADSVFFANLKKLIDKAGGGAFITMLRRGIARWYYFSVRLYSNVQN